MPNQYKARLLSLKLLKKSKVSFEILIAAITSLRRSVALSWAVALPSYPGFSRFLCPSNTALVAFSRSPSPPFSTAAYSSPSGHPDPTPLHSIALSSGGAPPPAPLLTGGRILLVPKELEGRGLRRWATLRCLRRWASLPKPLPHRLLLRRTRGPMEVVSIFRAKRGHLPRKKGAFEEQLQKKILAGSCCVGHGHTNNSLMVSCAFSLRLKRNLSTSSGGT